MADLTRDVPSTVAAKAVATWTLPMKTTSLQLISDSEVVAAAVDKHSLRQHAAGNPTPQPQSLRTSQAPHPASALISALTYSHPLAHLNMAIVAASVASTLPLQEWTTIFPKGKTIPVRVALTSKSGNMLERSYEAEHPKLVKEPYETEC